MLRLIGRQTGGRKAQRAGRADAFNTQLCIRVDSASRLDHRRQLHAQRRIVLDRRYLLLFRAVANTGAAAIAGMAFIAAPGSGPVPRSELQLVPSPLPP